MNAIQPKLAVVAIKSPKVATKTGDVVGSAPNERCPQPKLAVVDQRQQI
jgi:hypothetical protein